MKGAQQNRQIVINRNAVLDVKDKSFDLGDVLKPFVNVLADVFFPVYCHEPFR
jgi:hypothetical protein